MFEPGVPAWFILFRDASDQRCVRFMGARLAMLFGRFRHFPVAAFVVLLSSFMLSTPSEAGLPAVKMLTGVPIDPTTADSYYGSATTHTVGLCNLNAVLCGVPRATAIQELARSLSQGGSLSFDQFASNAFEYIYKNIDTEFRYGLSKGAFGALLDQSGTPFDQAHLMGELLKQGIAAYPAYNSYSVTYQAGTIALTASQFQAWTGLTNAAAACQYLANGGIPFSINGATPSSCSSLSGNVATVTMSYIWVSADGKLFDPSYKTYIQSAGIDLASAMSCGSVGAPTCGSSALSAALSGASTGFDSTAQANYVQTLNYSSLGTTLNTFAQRLQRYIQNNIPTARVQDVVGGHEINFASLPTPGTSLPYSNVTVQHSWSGDIPDQYRSRLNIQFDNINVWLYADETYGYWIEAGAAYSSAGTTRYGTLFFEREKGTSASTTPGLTVGGNPTNEVAPLATSTLGVSSAQATVALQVDHPYAANSGTFMDELENRELSFWRATVFDAGRSEFILLGSIVGGGRAGCG